MTTDDPHLDSAIALSTGGSLAFAAYGQPNGRPVYMFHGLPGSRFQAGMFHRQAVQANVQLIAFDRPGFGLSTQTKASTIVQVAALLSLVANHFHHERFAVVGVSCGGPYALQAAALFPQQVTSVGLLAGIGPADHEDTTRGRLFVLKLLFKLAAVHPALAAPVLLPDRLMFRGDANRAVRLLARALPAADRALIENDEEVARLFARGLSEAYRQGITGAAWDAHRIGNYRVCDVPDVTRPVHIFQGTEDRHVPLSTATFYREALATSTVTICKGEGHLSVAVNKFHECLQAIT